MSEQFFVKYIYVELIEIHEYFLVCTRIFLNVR
jgi:hypothetical protein